MNKYLFYLLVLLLPSYLSADTILETDDFILEKVYTGNRFWGIAALPNNDLLLTEFKTGNILFIQFINDYAKATTIPLHLSLENGAQAGLLDIALHPNFDTNRYVYITYSKKYSSGSSLALIRGKWDNNRLIEIRQLYETPIESKPQHYSGAIAFDEKNHLFLSSGERNHRRHSQNLRNPFGKILRFNDDGSIPKDNPLVKQPDAAKEIYAWGIRNAQGLAYDLQTKTLWQSEHGPQGGDELNIIYAGLNYGWPEVTTGQEYGGGRIGVPSKPGMIDPIKEWTPSPALSSLMIYTSKTIPSLTNKILIPSLVGQTIFVLTIENKKVTETKSIINGEIGRIRNVKSAPNGLLYIINDSGDLYRLRPR